MRRFTTFGPALVVLITAVATLFLVPEAIRRIGYASTDVQVRVARASIAQDDILERINAATRAIAKSVEPTVVHISVVSPEQRPGMRRAETGSGWVFDNQGHIVTNAHVARGALQGGEVTVQFFDGRAVPAEVVGVDTQTDIAVLSVRSRDGLFPAARATGDIIEQGDRVYAFGSPFNFKFSMSEGIVSGLGRDPREIIGEGGYTNFIQTDAAVNPGNSGGPLVDVKGRVVGMNVAIATAANPRGVNGAEGQNSGISFAIPLDTIESVVPALIANGVVQRGYLGVSLPDNDDQNAFLKRRLGFDRDGVVIPAVAKGGPAEQGGLRTNDIVLALNGIPTPSIGVLRQRITVNRPGDKANLRVWRGGQITDLSVTLGDLSRTEVAWRSVWESLARDYGLVVDNVDGRTVVVRVNPSKPAATDGFRPEQTIVGVDGKTFDTPQELLTELYDRGLLNGRRVPIEILETNGRRRSVDLQIAY
jgi:S1-C subfamily serine protease